MDYVPIKDSLLDSERLTLKRKWDAEWQADSDQRAAAFYAKKKAGLTTAKEEADFLAQDALLWEAEVQRRISAGLYHEVTKTDLQARLDNINTEAAELDAKIKAM